MTSTVVFSFNMEGFDEEKNKLHIVIYQIENKNYERCYSERLVCWSSWGRLIWHWEMSWKEEGGTG